MSIAEYVEAELAPKIRADGGWIEVISESGCVLRVAARAECAECGCLGRCVDWMQERIWSALGVRVEIIAERRPYLWRS